MQGLQLLINHLKFHLNSISSIRGVVRTNFKKIKIIKRAITLKKII